jgi:hypothetical protein
MKKALTSIRGAALTGLAWAVVWGPMGVLAGMIVDPDGSMDEMWVAIGAYPGFLCGAVFFAVLGIAERRRGLDGSPLSRVAAWGAAAGVLVGALPFAIGEPTSRVPLWQLLAGFAGSTTLLGAVSAVATALLVRHLARGRRPAGAGLAG